MEVVATIATTLATTHNKGAKKVFVGRLILRKAGIAVDTIGALCYGCTLDRGVELRY